MSLISSIRQRINRRRWLKASKIRNDQIFSIKEKTQEWLDKYLLTQNKDDLLFAVGLMRMAKMLDYENKFDMKITIDEKKKTSTITMDRRD